ncbi:n-terminal domain containing protein [Stylonychia lemnae]|uniref:propanoyl-CoA C-acyltransferase n=1 Tax=Stylonychia lemnae TaxID=5949 RepID=A0A078B4V0_STYLE|nr:n-terminal domain containing protein [Stylonychia lemnae]|eukprot:CDW89449.1 n-terminal domain containing protein [Stylonychia lemnae]
MQSNLTSQQQSNGQRVFVIGNGMTKFYKPGKHDYDYPDLAKLAIERSLRDANIKYDEVQAAYVGYVYGDSTCGQRAVYTVGMTGIPIVNVNNNCSTGSSALYLAHNAVKSGMNDCVMALGFEKMFTGSLQTFFPDRISPLDKFFINDNEMRGDSNSPFAPRLFGNAGREHIEKYGTKPEHFAKIAWKNHKHSVNNPYSQFRDEYTLEQIIKSPKIHEPLTKLQCCPTSDGAACAILASEAYVKQHNLQDQAVEILGITMTTDYRSTFDDKSSIKLIGSEMAKKCAQSVYKQAGISPKDVQVVELHDCFSANELCTYEALGLCPEGKAGEYIDKNEFTYGGKYVVNPSGGLISKGHPLGATGLAQCAELCWQVRGMADKRQVKDAKIALQHNLGLGGACVIVAYKKYQPGYQKNLRKDQSADPAILEKLEAAQEERPKL